MTDLVEFLRARLDEDAVDATMRAIHREGCESVPDAEGYTYPCTCGVPERLMREVEAKQQIVNYERTGALGSLGINAWGVWRDMLKLLAMPYADHPDYRQEWKLQMS